MLEATKDSIRLLSEATSDAIVDSLAATKSVLEELYKSGVGGFSEEEIKQDLATHQQISERITSVSSIEEKLQIYASDEKPFLSKFGRKYSDFLPERIIDFFRFSEEKNKGYIKLVHTVKLITAAYEKEVIESLSIIYSGLATLSEVLEQYGSYFSKGKSLLPAIRVFVSKILTTSILDLKQLDSFQAERMEKLNLHHQEIVSNLTAIKNTARGILWQLDQAEKERKFPVGDLLNWLDTSPGWAGDDFDECLDYVNRTRK